MVSREELRAMADEVDRLQDGTTATERRLEEARAQVNRLIQEKDQWHDSAKVAEAALERVRGLLGEVDLFTPMDSRDAGEVFHAESVRDLICDLRGAIDGETEVPGSAPPGLTVERLTEAIQYAGDTGQLRASDVARVALGWLNGEARMSEKTPKERAARAIEATVRRFPIRESRIPDGTIGWGATMPQLAQAALDAAVEDREGLARVLAESMPCTWSIPQDGHPYDDGCVHRRDGQGRGACWDQAWELATAVARWLTGDES